LVNVEKPSVLNLVLAHLAQSLVVTCIGLNMGVR
jgi:hypothetical protein